MPYLQSNIVQVGSVETESREYLVTTRPEAGKNRSRCLWVDFADSCEAHRVIIKYWAMLVDETILSYMGTSSDCQIAQEPSWPKLAVKRLNGNFGTTWTRALIEAVMPSSVATSGCILCVYVFCNFALFR